MGNNKNIGTYFLFLLLLLIVFLGMILLIFNTSGKLLILEVALLGFYLFLAFVSLFGIYFGSRWGFTLLGIMFVGVMFNLMVLFYFKRSVGNVFFLTTVMSAIGFIASISSIKREDFVHEPIEEVVDEKVPPVEVTFEPGKYLASKSGSVYHIGTCEWGKKIGESKRVWYQTSDEAEKEGLKKHSCVE